MTDLCLAAGEVVASVQTFVKYDLKPMSLSVRSTNNVLDINVLDLLSFSINTSVYLSFILIKITVAAFLC